MAEEKENGENGESSPSTSALTYCVERLIRGLASTRESSLQGFFICLVELLRQHAKVNDEASIDHVFETISKVLHVKGSKSVSFNLLIITTLAYVRSQICLGDFVTPTPSKRGCKRPDRG